MINVYISCIARIVDVNRPGPMSSPYTSLTIGLLANSADNFYETI